MKPLVKNPLVSPEQLASELTDPKQLQTALNSPGEIEGESQADVVLSQLGQKLMRVLRKAEHKAETNPELKETLNRMHESWGVEPKNLHSHLRELGPSGAGQFLREHAGLLREVDEIRQAVGTDYRPIISEHEDELVIREQSYGDNQRPEDYLDSFKHFIEEQVNRSVALAVVVKRPRDLTREQLKEVRLLLDAQGYSEAHLQSAVREQSNQDIAASIIVPPVSSVTFVERRWVRPCSLSSNGCCKPWTLSTLVTTSNPIRGNGWSVWPNSWSMK